VLTNWYIRRSRDRFWAGDQAAIDTLHTVLDVVCRVAAPLLPLVTDHVHRGLTGGDSVHLADWPSASELPSDPDLVRSMDLVRDVCSATLSIRKSKSLRVRLPLAKVTVAFPGSDALAPYVDVIADEVNVKSVDLKPAVESDAAMVLQALPAALGPRLGGRTQEVIKAIKSGDWSHVDGRVVAGGIELQEGEYTLKLVAAEGSASTTLSDGVGMITLDTNVTPELAAEGTARDLVRLVQQARRDAGLEVSDRIDLVLGVAESIRRQVQPFVAMIGEETLSTSVSWGSGPPTAKIDDDDIFISVTKAV